MLIGVGDVYVRLIMGSSRSLRRVDRFWTNERDAAPGSVGAESGWWKLGRKRHGWGKNCGGADLPNGGAVWGKGKGKAAVCVGARQRRCRGLVGQPSAAKEESLVYIVVFVSQSRIKTERESRRSGSKACATPGSLGGSRPYGAPRLQSWFPLQRPSVRFLPASTISLSLPSLPAASFIPRPFLLNNFDRSSDLPPACRALAAPDSFAYSATSSSCRTDCPLSLTLTLLVLPACHEFPYVRPTLLLGHLSAAA